MSASAQNTPKNGTQTVKTPTDGGTNATTGKAQKTQTRALSSANPRKRKR